MYARIRRLLMPPVPDDEDKARIARLLNIILLTCLLASLLVSVTGFAFGLYVTAWTMLAGSALVVGMIVLARRGHYTLTSVLFLTALTGTMTFLLYVGQGIHDVGAMVYPIIIIMASLLLDRRALVLFTLLAVATLGGVVFAEINGHIVTDFGPVTSIADLVFATIILAVSALCMRLLLGDLTRNLQRAQRNEQALAESNRRLAQQTAQWQASQARWRSLVENAPDLIMNVHRDGSIAFINAQTDDGPAPGKSVYDFTDPAYRARMSQAVETVFDTGRPARFEVVGTYLGGQAAWFETRLSPIHQGDRVESLTLIATDITEQKRAEHELRASEQKFSKAFQASPDAILITSIPEGIILNVNQGFTRISGYTAEEALGKTTRQLAIWYDLAERDRMFEALKTEKRLDEMEIRIRIKSGEQRTCLHSAEIVEIDGQPCLLSVVRDVTERRRAAQEREELITELEAQNAELERFTYTVSHDLKTPLVTIKGFLGALQQDAADGDTERMKHDIARIGSAADTMARLLSELLELSRIGRQINPPEAVSLTELAHEAAALMDGPTRNGSVAIEINPAMPTVHGDRVRLLEVYQNLVENAVKFMGAQPQPRVEIGATQDGTEVICYVRDNGAGIDPRYQDKVFKLFERLDQRIDGTGIGLALVKRIVEVHGGRVWVESGGEGKGATFYFTLPAANGAMPGC